jgi:hypothetical protein
MNGSPPPLSPVTPPPLPPQRSRKTAGCMGCLIGLASLLALIALGGIALWMAYGYLVDKYTSDQPGTIRVASPNANDIRSAELALRKLRQAMSANQKQEIQFTADNLNSLIAADPDFRSLKGKTYVGLADSEMILETALPLGNVHLPKLKNRWLNVTAHLVFSYATEGFHFDFRSGSAQGSELPSSFMQSFNRSFSKSFGEKFREAQVQHPAVFWNRIDQITLQGDKLIVVTKGLSP